MYRKLAFNTDMSATCNLRNAVTEKRSAWHKSEGCSHTTTNYFYVKIFMHDALMGK